VVSHSSLTLLRLFGPVDITGVGGLGKFAYGAGKRTRVGGGTYGRLTRRGGGRRGAPAPARGRPSPRWPAAAPAHPGRARAWACRGPRARGGSTGGRQGSGDVRAKISFQAMACGPRGSAGGAHGTVHHLLLHCGG
jgi:hypothetical protein